MLRRSFLASATASLAQPIKRPNLLFVTADDLGLVLGCYGEKRIATPNLDRLAASGVRFTTAWVAQASCSPSRSAMLTGLYPHSNGQYGLANTGFALHENMRDKTLPNVLRKAGYKTGIIGKLHVEPESSFQWDYRGKPDGPTRRVKSIAGEAEQFIKSSGGSPFFLMVNYSDPHAFRNAKAPGGWDFPPQIDGVPENPLPPSEKTLFNFQQVDTPAQRTRTAGYLNAVERLDVGIGLLMQMLKRTGNDGNTVVVFCGDHGPPFARGKTTTYEPGLRVPFFLRWPGVTKPGMVSKRMVSTVDIMPTLLDAAGVSTPQPLHGQTLRQAVTGGQWREYLGAEFHWHGANPFYPRRAIRDGRYHLIHNLRAGQAKPSTGIDGDQAISFAREPRYNGTKIRHAFETFADPPEFELYDIENDAIEFHNLSGEAKHAKTESRLKAALLDWRKQTADPFLDAAFIEKWAKDGAPATRPLR